MTTRSIPGTLTRPSLDRAVQLRWFKEGASQLCTTSEVRCGEVWWSPLRLFVSPRERVPSSPSTLICPVIVSLMVLVV